MVSAAANVALDIIDDEAFLARVREAGERLLERLLELPTWLPRVRRGLMVGSKWTGPAPRSRNARC